MRPFPITKTLFWDIDISKADVDKSKNFIIERVLARGGMSDVKKIFSLYTIDEIIVSIKKSKNLDKVTHNFCSEYFRIPKEEMYAPSEYY